MKRQLSKKRGVWDRLWSGMSGHKGQADGARKQASAPISAYAEHGSQSYFFAPGKPVWTPRRYDRFADEAYTKNVVAHRAIGLIAQAVGSVHWRLRRADGVRDNTHPALALLNKPNPCIDAAALIESLVSYRLIAGNAYLQAVGPDNRAPLELHVLRPDRVQVLAGKHASCIPAGYRFTHAKGHTDFPVNPLTGRSRILHWKQFNPLSDWYGLSSVEAAAYSIDQHNQAGAWNQALLQNGARPSGALVVQQSEANGALSDDQYRRLKDQIDLEFSGAQNAGRPLLLEGGLDWREMSMNPKDMDYINAKHSAARDIALAFGVPPQLLGIPGDNTYSNLKEARLGLWEQTILPLLDNLTRALNGWLLPYWPDLEDLTLDYDRDSISALTPRREAHWERINNAGFLSDDEKREILL